MNETLFTFTCQNLPLAEALAAFGSVIGSEHATAILYSPRCCRLANWESGRLYGHDGQPIDVASVFEARVFNTVSEFRWLNDPGPQRRHRAVILTEHDLSQALGDSWQAQKTECVDTLPQTYLLWGEGTGRLTTSAWSELATSRIGALPVPINGVGKSQRVLLNSVEYLVELEHGNVIVFDERLVKIGKERQILAEIESEESNHV